jgi:hypothetical protein
MLHRRRCAVPADEADGVRVEIGTALAPPADRCSADADHTVDTLSTTRSHDIHLDLRRTANHHAHTPFQPLNVVEPTVSRA